MLVVREVRVLVRRQVFLGLEWGLEGGGRGIRRAMRMLGLERVPGVQVSSDDVGVYGWARL